MKIYQFESYTEAIFEAIDEKKMNNSKWTMAQLAQACLMQPSYVTNVLKGRGDFNTEQLFRICEQLDLNAEQTEFITLLLEIKKTSYPKRKVQLEKKIAEIRSRHLRAEKILSVKTVELTAEQLEKYYLDPFIQLVHIYLGINNESTLDSLTLKFGIPKLQMAQVLGVLEEIKYIQKKAGQYLVLVGGRHLPRESHILKPHQILIRLKSLDQMQRLSPDQNYNFSATISTTPEVRTQLQAEFLKFLKVAEKLVKGHEAKKLYQINFDLFPWEID
ncbi:MAG: helix-turn-helix transcriptional regulator [Pseudobdellovibrio sp.]